MNDSPYKRIVYICVIGIAAIAPIVVSGDRYIGGIFSLVSIWFVMLYIRADRNEQSRLGFPVIPFASLADAKTPHKNEGQP